MADKDLVTDLDLQQFWSNCLATFRMNGGTLLWENTSGTGAQAETTLTGLPDLSQYKYLIFGYYDDNADNTKVMRFEKVEYKAPATFCLNLIPQDTSVQWVVSRVVRILSSTSVKIDQAYLNKSTTNANVYLTVMCIYGTNDLGYVANVGLEDVKINNTSIVNGNGVANIVTEGTYNASSNKIATMNDLPTSVSEVEYLTTAPSSANTSGKLKFVVLSSEPSTYYNGYIYYITEA
jgi:hypothetical protein